MQYIKKKHNKSNELFSLGAEAVVLQECDSTVPLLPVVV